MYVAFLLSSTVFRDCSAENQFVKYFSPLIGTRLYEGEFTVGDNDKKLISAKPGSMIYGKMCYRVCTTWHLLWPPFRGCCRVPQGMKNWFIGSTPKVLDNKNLKVIPCMCSLVPQTQGFCKLEKKMWKPCVKLWCQLILDFWVTCSKITNTHSLQTCCGG